MNPKGQVCLEVAWAGTCIPFIASAWSRYNIEAVAKLRRGGRIGINEQLAQYPIQTSNW